MNRVRGAVFAKSELDCIRGVIGEDTTRSRTGISRTVCEQLGWYRPDGTPKTASMSQVLMKMEADGHITLPPLSRTHSTQMKPIEHSERTAMSEEILLPFGKLSRIHIEIAKTGKEKSLWNEYIDRY